MDSVLAKPKMEELLPETMSVVAPNGLPDLGASSQTGCRLSLGVLNTENKNRPPFFFLPLTPTALWRLGGSVRDFSSSDSLMSAVLYRPEA